MDRKEYLEQLKMDYLQCFETEGGKRVLEDLMKFTRFNEIFNPVCADGHVDPYKLAGHNAQCAVMIYILKNLKEKKHERRTSIAPEGTSIAPE